MEIRKSRRGIFFSIDALIASSIIILGLILVSSFYISEKRPTSINFQSSDMIHILSELSISEVNSSYVTQLIADGEIPEISLNNSIAEVMGEMWATNKTGIVYNLSQEFIEPYIDSRFGYGLYIGNEEIAIRNKSVTSSSVSAQKMISGIDKDKVILGYSTKAYLSSIKDRLTSSFAYFGGFEGEGNLTKRLVLPSGFNLTSAYLEVEAGTDFKLYVNNNFCGDFPQGSGNGSYMIPDRWDINLSICNKSYFVDGVNNISINFEAIDENFSAVGPHYIAGGYFRATYLSDDVSNLEITYDDYNNSIYRYYFPGIHGFLNLYSSFYVPGILNQMNMRVKYYSNYSTYLTIGNVTIFDDNPFGSSDKIINNSEILAILANNSMNYSDFSLMTTPLRLGLSNVSVVISPVDIVLATDISGSMNWRLDNNNNGVTRSCNDTLLNDPSTKRISGARCAGKAMVDDVLSNEGPSVGLVSYEQTTEDIFSLSNDSTALKNELDSYSVGGGTCICCGVRDAVNMLILDNMNTIISRKTGGWRYNDNDLSSPPSNWETLGFDDSSWKSGTGVFRNSYNSLGSPRTILNKYEGDYYFRRKFNITNTSEINDSKIFVLSDNGADIYLNGVLVDNDYSSNNHATYWNRNGITVNKSLFVDGENIIAIRLRNTEACFLWWCWPTDVAFDLELAVSTVNVGTPKQKAIIVMTDGEANYRCNGAYSVALAKQDAIDEACAAYADYGIRVFTVGFGYSADSATLGAMANCSNGQYFNSTSVDDLIDAYKQISQYLVEFASSQTANYSDLLSSSLDPTSYIELNYSAITNPPQYGKIPITIESPIFNNNISGGSILIPDDIELLSLYATSYSADAWTSQVNVSNSDNNTVVFNLSSYERHFYELGDAYNVYIPVNLIKKGEENYIDVTSGTEPNNLSLGSAYNKLIYTVEIDSILDFSGVFSNNVGCNWSLLFEDGSNGTVLVPVSYNGTKICDYFNAVYDTDDATDEAAYRLFSRLDLDGDGLLEVRLDQSNLLIDSLSIEDIPSMWGPAILEVRVWQ